MDVNNLLHADFSLDHLPTPQQSALAKSCIVQYANDINSLSAATQEEEARLAELVQQAQDNIRANREKQFRLERNIARAQAYLAPVRRLPNELLRQVFLIIFRDGDRQCAWTLSRVNRLWRHVTLSLPVIWSSIQLTTTTALLPADTIRLWLERSGTRCPLDIDITLKATSGNSPLPEKPVYHSRRRIFPHPTHQHLPSLWSAVGNTSSHNHTSLSPPHGAYGASSSKSEDADLNSGAAASWGHIVFYYLVAQIHRWRKFRFLFSTPFPSLKALDTIQGSAPMLEEFVVGCNESTFFSPASEQWTWLPSFVPPSLLQSSVVGRMPDSERPTPLLTSLELRNVPFRWSSPLLSGLKTLKLVSNNLSVQPLALNRILVIIQASPLLEVLELSVVSQQNILPLIPVKLEHLRELKLGGGSQTSQSSLLQSLIGQLILPALQSLTIEAEARAADSTTMAETLNSLLLRSSSPTITSFSYSCGQLGNSHPSSYNSYHILGGFPLTVLPNLYHLQKLVVQSCPLESILSILASAHGQQDIDHPDDETDFGGPGGTGGFGGVTIIPPPSLPPTILMIGNGGATTNAGAGFGTGTGTGTNSNSTTPGGATTTATGLTAAELQTGAMLLNNHNNANAGIPNATNNHHHLNNDDYLCPFLRHLTFKNCHPQSDGVSKIINLVAARNPEGDANAGNGDASIPRRLKTLEFLDCSHIGGDDVVDWLKQRVEKVVHTEAPSPTNNGFRTSTLTYPYNNF